MFRGVCFGRWLVFVLLAWPVLAEAGHWAFVPPQETPLPTVRNVDWPSNELDRFILAKLEAVGVAPSKQASRLLGICFWREGFEAAFGPERRG